MSDPLYLGESFSSSSVEDWMKLVEKSLQGKPYEALFSYIDEVKMKPLYTEADILDLKNKNALLPGLNVSAEHIEARATGGWSICQEYEQKDLEVASKAIEEDMHRGVNALWLRTGINHGIHIHTVDQLDQILKNVQIDRTSLWFEPRADVLSVTAAYVSLADRKGIHGHQLKGCLGADPIGTLAYTGTLPSGFQKAMRDMVSVATFARRFLPQMKSILVTTRPYALAGATIVHELAWAISTAIEYLRILTKSDFQVDEAAKAYVFAFSVGKDFFPEIAKLRAARKLWAHVVKESGGSLAAQTMHIHASTTYSTKTKYDPWVNLLRSTAESAAAVLGGADSIATLPFDILLKNDDSFSRRVASNTQLVLRDEAHLHRVFDPSSGSYFIESLTEEIAQLAWKEVQIIERMGGMSRALRNGHIINVINKTVIERRELIEKRKTPILGVSEYPYLNEKTIEGTTPIMVDDSFEVEEQIERAAHEQRHMALMQVLQLAQSHGASSELVEATVTAVHLGVDLYHTSAAFRLSQPSFHIEPLALFRDAQVFEKFRAMSDHWLSEKGTRPRVYIFRLGDISQSAARISWIQNTLAAGGFESIVVEVIHDLDQMLLEFEKSNDRLAMIAGPDEVYVEKVPALAEDLDRHGARTVMLAGKPGDREKMFRDSKVSMFFYMGANIYELLKKIYKALEVS